MNTHYNLDGFNNFTKNSLKLSSNQLESSKVLFEKGLTRDSSFLLSLSVENFSKAYYSRFFYEFLRGEVDYKSFKDHLKGSKLEDLNLNGVGHNTFQIIENMFKLLRKKIALSHWESLKDSFNKVNKNKLTRKEYNITYPCFNAIIETLERKISKYADIQDIEKKLDRLKEKLDEGYDEALPSVFDSNKEINYLIDRLDSLTYKDISQSEKFEILKNINKRCARILDIFKNIDKLEKNVNEMIEKDRLYYSIYRIIPLMLLFRKISRKNDNERIVFNPSIDLRYYNENEKEDLISTLIMHLKNKDIYYSYANALEKAINSLKEAHKNERKK